MLENLRSWVLFLTFLLLTNSAQATELGMFLCPSPIMASSLFSALIQAQTIGVTLNHNTGLGIATKNGCNYFQANDLKPVDFVDGELLISGGQVKGWADPHLYIAYVNN